MWYGASILMRGEANTQPPDEWLWEENVVLFDADSAEQASEFAAQYGRAHEDSFTAVSGDEIHWVYDRVYSVFEIGERPVSATEVYSRFLRASEVASLLTPFE